MIRSGVVSAVSVGFLPIQATPLPKGGSRFTKWELLEVSFVSVPCNPNAIVTARSLPTEQEAARLRLAELRRQMNAPAPLDAALVRSRARRTLADLKARGAW
jgi:phage head maturation protease